MDNLIEEISNTRFTRVDEFHPIDWRIDDRAHPSKLALISDADIPNKFDTNGVSIVSFLQNTGKYAIVFVLKDALCSETFEAFCKDVIESSRNINQKDAPDFAYNRFINWMYLFMPAPLKKMEEIEIRGLIGELYALSSIFIPKYGPESAIMSWMNSHKGKQDFIEYDKWYEIKTLLEGKDRVQISSLEQMNRDDVGELIIINMRITSTESTSKITLNTMYNKVIEMLPSIILKKRFSEIIVSNDYIPNDPYYDEICVEIINATGYEVIDSFPRLTPNNVPYEGICSAKYEILLDSITGFEVEKWI